MRIDDLTAVTALAGRIHVAHPESPAIFAERLRLYPRGCFALPGEAAVLGYAVTHPGRIGTPPPLNTLLGDLPQHPDCLYLHDVAIAPEATRRGHGSDLVARLGALAAEASLPFLALVAVSGSAAYWARLGFRSSGDAALAAKLASYGPEALYMTRRVSGAGMPDGL